MLLVKCKCGCKFTLSETRERKHYIHCPDCQIQLTEESECLPVILGELEKNADSVSMIPDGAKFEVSFDI